MLPVSTPPNAIVHGSGQVPLREMITILVSADDDTGDREVGEDREQILDDGR